MGETSNTVYRLEWKKLRVNTLESIAACTGHQNKTEQKKKGKEQNNSGKNCAVRKQIIQQ